VARTLAERAELVTARPASPAEIAQQLHAGRILARCAGRSEFGPRALGGRSLLASPLLAAIKDRLNRIKGRQPWRPVAPVVARERLHEVFDGPADSPWMTFSHRLRPEVQGRLPALHHPDDSTRAQSLVRAQDPWLHDLLLAFAALTGYAVLVNTSLNGPDEPILETAEQALTWFLANDDVDALLLDEMLVERRPIEQALGEARYFPRPGAFVLLGPLGEEKAPQAIVRAGSASLVLQSRALVELFVRGEGASLSALQTQDPSLDLQELWRLVARGLLSRRDSEKALTAACQGPGGVQRKQERHS
jgi:carbamoyltransferase